jgi:hypothetical protein
MSGDDSKIVEFPKAAVPPEERARRLKVEVERLAGLPAVEWLFYVESDGVAEKHGVSRVVLKEMIEATIKANEKKAREDKAEDRQRIQRVEKDKVTAEANLRNHAIRLRNRRRRYCLRRSCCGYEKASNSNQPDHSYPPFYTRRLFNLAVGAPNSGICLGSLSFS